MSSRDSCKVFSSCPELVQWPAEAGGFLVKQKSRAGGGRQKKPKASSREATPDGVEGSPTPGNGSQASPSPSPAASPAVDGGRDGDPFEEEEREAVMLSCLVKWS